MAYEQKEGQGALFKNTKKNMENQPDYRGDCKINGVDCWLSAWIKEGKNGKFMSLAIAPKEADYKPGVQEKKPAGKFDDMEDDIPF